MKADVFNSYTKAQQKDQLAKYIQPIDARYASHGCSDGRKCVAVLKHGADVTDGSLFTKNFGGALGAASSLQIYMYMLGKPMTYEAAIEQTIKVFTAHKYDVGDHRDVNAHQLSDSGCNYADNRAKIIKRATDTPYLKEFLNTAYGEPIIRPDTRALYEAVIAAYKALHADLTNDPHKMPDGALLVDYLEAHDGTTQILEGSHTEYAVIINRLPNSTLSINSLINDKGSVYSIDEHHVLDQQNTALKIPQEIAKMINYIDWLCTYFVLVLDEGKPPLPFLIYE